MSNAPRVALVEPLSLLGQSVREALEADADLQLELFGLDAEEFGTLSEVRGEVALVLPLSAESLAGIDLAVVCGDGRRQQLAIEALPATTRVLIVASDFDHPAGELRVSGIGDSDPTARLVVSPHPTVILLTRLLAAVAEHDPTRVSATLLLPASTQGNEGLDELFAQTRAIVAFSDQPPPGVFGQQLAFNLIPTPATVDLGAQVRQVLGHDIVISTNLLTASVFHGLAASLLIDMSAAPSARALKRSLDDSPFVQRSRPSSPPDPISVAGRDEIVVATPTSDGSHPEAVWLWAVMDNLTSSAANVVGLARQLLGIG